MVTNPYISTVSADTSSSIRGGIRYQKGQKNYSSVASGAVDIRNKKSGEYKYGSNDTKS